MTITPDAPIEARSGWTKARPINGRARYHRTVLAPKGQFVGVVERRADGAGWDWYVRHFTRIVRWGECDELAATQRKVDRNIATLTAEAAR